VRQIAFEGFRGGHKDSDQGQLPPLSANPILGLAAVSTGIRDGMLLLDWLLVLFGALVALVGLWMRRKPGQVFALAGTSPNQAPAMLAQVRLLGACFLMMGSFFAVQMAVDLAHEPWWIGTLGGVAVALVVNGGSAYRKKPRPSESASPEAYQAR
jgi:hypothetical protein